MEIAISLHIHYSLKQTKQQFGCLLVTFRALTFSVSIVFIVLGPQKFRFGSGSEVSEGRVLLLFICWTCRWAWVEVGSSAISICV